GSVPRQARWPGRPCPESPSSQLPLVVTAQMVEHTRWCLSVPRRLLGSCSVPKICARISFGQDREAELCQSPRLPACEITHPVNTCYQKPPRRPHVVLDML
ncbi:hypothetical protein HAX54_040375, partial [Datura stramonium]|nr:hypothetical protein [Datura stramonium]